MSILPKKPVIIVHGGAWSIPDELIDATLQGVQRAAQAGIKILMEGGSALDAVEAAINVMEDDPVFDAGTGSVLTESGTVEMDAMIMDGDTLEAGAVAGLRSVKNPVNLARGVMEETPHVMMIGEGAESLAEQLGLERTTQDKLVTEEARRDLERYFSSGHYGYDLGHDTCGAVALDASRRVAAGTSTGGVTGKRVGRVGDVPIVGSGGYADSLVGGASATGHGESIMKVNLSRLAAFHMEQGVHPQEAAEKALGYMLERVKGHGGLIAMNSEGEVGFYYTTPRMAWAYVRDGEFRSGVESP